MKQDLSTALDMTDFSISDLDITYFHAALLVQYIFRFVSNGGRWRGDDYLLPDVLTAFIDRAKMYANQRGHFETAWKQVQDSMPSCKAAWELGQILFLSDLDRAESDPEDLGYLSQMDFADSCYAYPNARKIYPHNPMLHRWLVNGYMVAWGRHFLEEEEGSVGRDRGVESGETSKHS